MNFFECCGFPGCIYEDFVQELWLIPGAHGELSPGPATSHKKTSFRGLSGFFNTRISGHYVPFILGGASLPWGAFGPIKGASPPRGLRPPELKTGAFSPSFQKVWKHGQTDRQTHTPELFILDMKSLFVILDAERSQKILS